MFVVGAASAAILFALFLALFAAKAAPTVGVVGAV